MPWVLPFINQDKNGTIELDEFLNMMATRWFKETHFSTSEGRSGGLQFQAPWLIPREIIQVEG